MGATVIGPMTIARAVRQRVDAGNAQRRNFPMHPDVTGGSADERIVSKNGSFQIEGGFERR